MTEDDSGHQALDRLKGASREEKLRLIDELIRSGEMLSVLGALASAYADPRSHYEMAALLSEVPSFDLSSEAIDVRTVASYYYAVSGGGIESSLVSLSSALGEKVRTLIIAEGDCGTDEDRKSVPGVSIAAMRREDESRFEALARALQENEVDVLIHHAWFDANLLWDVALCRILGVRVVLNVHGVFSHFLDVTDGSFASWNDGRLFASVPRVAALCDAVVGQTVVNKRFFGQFNARAYEIRNALPKNLLEQASCCEADVREGSARADATILWVGRFDVYKHPEDAVRALARVRSRGTDARLVMVGESGYETYERELEDLAKSLGISEHVAFEGFQEQVGRYYEGSSILLLTSEIEGYCMVLAEACAYGLPVVAYDLPYLPFASCGGIGWVAQGDVESAADKIVSLLNDESKRNEMGCAARHFISEGDGARSEDSWNDVLRDVAQGRARCDKVCDSLDRTMWDTLFCHYIKGAERTHIALEQRETDLAQKDVELAVARTAQQVAEEALAACRREYEESYSYRLGHALLGVPRLAAKLFCRRRDA